MDINANHSMLIEAMSKLESQNPADVYFSIINTNITVLDESSREFKVIKDSVYNTVADEHKFNLWVDAIYEVNKPLFDIKYKSFEKLGNKHMLFHGTWLSNLVSILKNGLKIAPLEA